MAERRMFAKTIIDSDAFLDLPLSSQCLYFHLSMRADDDGFVNNPKKIMRMIGASEDDCKLLLHKRFLITFDSGVVVIKHWKIHNYIQNDRHKPTVYKEEMAQLTVKPNKSYSLAENPYEIEVEAECIQDVSTLDTQVRLGKDRLELGKDSNSGGKTKRFTPPTTTDINDYCKEKGIVVDAERFIDYYSAQNWKLSNGNKMSDWKAAVRNWARRDKEKPKQAQTKQEKFNGFKQRTYDYKDLENKLLGM